MTKVIAVDPGEARIGLAISDSSGILARPLKVIGHLSRMKNAERIVQEAEDQGAEVILVGVALDLEGEVGPQARKALRLVNVLRTVTDLPIVTWDESGSTQKARKMGKKDTLIDARAAAFILQEFLDATQR